jgi:hypothetical protein
MGHGRFEVESSQTHGRRGSKPTLIVGLVWPGLSMWVFLSLGYFDLV